jgi:hypothetical protein
LETSIQGFNTPLAGYLSSLGLPTEKVLDDFAERRFVLHALQQTLEVLPYDQRAKAATTEIALDYRKNFRKPFQHLQVWAQHEAEYVANQ